MATHYRNRKKEFDDIVYAYLVKRLRCPTDRSDSYFTGAVDDMGNPIGEHPAEWAYTNLDKFVARIKSMLGERGVQSLTADYDDIDPMYLMNGGKVEGYWDRFDPVISLVEETAYLPPEQRGRGEYTEGDSEEGLTKEQRLERALTIANFIIASIKNNGELISEESFNNYVLPSVEATFNVRSVGSRGELIDYMKKGGLCDYRQLLPEGHLLAVRLAKHIAKSELCHGDGDEDDYGRLWRQLASYGR